jgi:hypothetical protein
MILQAGNKPLAQSHPSWREWLLSLLVFPFASAFFSIFIVFGIDAVFPNFLSDVPGPGNQVRMFGVWLTLTIGLFVWSTRTNRKHKYYLVYADRFEVGKPARIVVPVVDVTRIRVGAPMSGALTALHKVNAAAGALSRKNRAAAEALAQAFANTVVLDFEDQSVVIHLGTLTGGSDVFRTLVERCPGRLTVPEYTDAERKVFGRFKPGLYNRSK